jgi:hypothetical protein
MKRGMHGKYFTFPFSLKIYPCTQTGDVNFIISIYEGGGHAVA